MDQINKVKSISIWIFIVPFAAVNICLILITQFHELFPHQEQIIHNTIPYLDGGASISRTARPYPSWLVFKPAMFLTSFLLIKYWLYNKQIIEFFNKDQIELHPCGKEFLIRRKDDNIDVVLTRYETYMKTTKPVLDFYSKNANFIEIDGADEIEQITNKINHVLNV